MASKTVLSGTEQPERQLMTPAHSKIVSVCRVEPRPSRVYDSVLKTILVLNYTEICPCSMHFMIQKFYRTKGLGVFFLTV